MSHCRQARSNYFSYSANACFQLLFTFEKNSLPPQSQSISALNIFPKHKDLWCPWDLSPDLFSRYQQMQFEGAAQFSHLLSTLAYEVVFFTHFTSRTPLRGQALQLPTQFITWSFATMTTIKTYLSKSMFYCMTESGPLAHDALGYFTVTICTVGKYRRPVLCRWSSPHKVFLNFFFFLSKSCFLEL